MPDDILVCGVCTAVNTVTYCDEDSARVHEGDALECGWCHAVVKVVCFMQDRPHDPAHWATRRREDMPESVSRRWQPEESEIFLGDAPVCGFGREKAES